MNVRIRVERSGGFAGISISKEMDAKDLPPALIRAAKKIVEDNKAPPLLMRPPPKGAADYYTYKISIDDGKNQNVIECNQYNIQDDLKSLITYIENNAKK